MANNRQERMQGRMRGAQRHQIEDDAFDFFVPIIPEAIDVPIESDTASTSASAQDASSTGSGDESTPKPTEDAPVVIEGGGYASEELQSTPVKHNPSTEADPPTATRAGPAIDAPVADATPLVLQPALDVPSSTQAFIAEALDELTAGLAAGPDADLPSSPIQQLNRRVTTRRISPRTGGTSQRLTGSPGGVAATRARRSVPVLSSPPMGDEVGESPANAPGSGQRRFVNLGEAAQSGSRLQEALRAGDSQEPPSPIDSEVPVGDNSISPLADKAQRTSMSQRPRRAAQQAQKPKTTDEDDSRRPSPPTRARRGAVGPEAEAEKESEQAASNAAVVKSTNGKTARNKIAGTGPRRRRTRQSLEPPAFEKPQEPHEPEVLQVPEEPQEPSSADATEAVVEDVAEEIGDQEAARRLGRKRLRPSPPVESPEPMAEEDEATAPKRRRRNAPSSPARQAQPVPRPKIKPPAKSTAKPKTKPTAKRLSKGAKRTSQGAEADETARQQPVAIAIQRFTKASLNNAADQKYAKLLTEEIPHATKSSVHAVDVLAQLCDDVTSRRIEKLREGARTLTEASERRQNNTMRMSLEAFLEELKTRFLEHSHVLDTAHALQKRIREAQKRKTDLREQVMRIRAEKERVLLRQDAIRIRHEAQRQEAQRYMAISSSMHDVDLAIEKGATLATVSRVAEKEAMVANLELAVSQVAEQVCSQSDGGGLYKQLKDFNDFLERTAMALERRAR